MYVQRGSKGARVGAFFLDSLFLAMGTGILAYFAPYVYAGIYPIAMFFYFAICEGSGLHASLGKRICGLMVVDEYDCPLNYGKAFLRSVCRLLSCATCGVGFLIGLFRPDARALHDIIAKTRVVKRDSVYPVASGYEAGPPVTQPVGMQVPLPAARNGGVSCPQVLGVSGPLAGRTYPVPGQGLLLGRDASSCEIMFPVNQSGISRMHCRVQYDARNGTFLLYDTGSTYGTFVDGGQVFTGVPAVLRSGDEFWLASPENRFRVIL